MPTNFGTTPLSTTTLGANQFPGTAVFVPGSGAAGNLTMVEGIAINTDANSFQTSAVRMGQLDGDDVTLGAKADAAVTGDTSGTISAKLRGLNKVLASLNAAGQNAASPANELLVAGQFNTTPTTISSGNISPLQLDSSGNLLVNIKAGSLAANQSTNVAQFAGTNVVTGTGASGAGIPRVTVSNDSQVALTVAASGGSVPYHNLSAASTNSTNVKGAACKLYSVSFSNTNSAARYVKLYDKATAPTIGTDTPKHTFQIPGNGLVAQTFPEGVQFSNGFGWGTTTGVADSDTGAVAANDLVVDFRLNS